jgi:hypothetical protein
MLVMEGNMLDYEQELESEVLPGNNTLSIENQHINHTSDYNQNRKKPEVQALTHPHQRRA